MKPVEITLFSDILCVWAWVAQARVDELNATFGSEIRIVPRFVSIFGDTAAKFGEGWKDRGGFDGYAAHVRSVAERFPQAAVDGRVWTQVRPRSSLSPHLYIAAAASIDPRAEAPLTLALRRAFFVEAGDIGLREVQDDVARAIGLDLRALGAAMDDGRAAARLASDHAAADKARIEGSPTFLLNEGRQRLYGNVGFRVIEANIRELLRTPLPDQASWC